MRNVFLEQLSIWRCDRNNLTIFRCIFAEITIFIFLEQLSINRSAIFRKLIQMLYLQSIPSRSREGAQIHAVGAKNIYLLIYEISRPQMNPFPPNNKNTAKY